MERRGDGRFANAGTCSRCSNVLRCLHRMAQVDVDLNSEAAEKYDIEAMPTFKLIKGGTVVASIQGADAAAVEAAINQYK